MFLHTECEFIYLSSNHNPVNSHKVLLEWVKDNLHYKKIQKHIKYYLMCLFIQKIKMAPWRGLEPPTLRLTAECSAIELPRNKFIWQRPTLPPGLPGSTIGALKLNLRVRNGYGCYLQAIITRYIERTMFFQNCTEYY